MLLTTTLIATSVCATDLRIEQVLRDTTIAVVSVKNVESLSQKFTEMGLCDSMCELVSLFDDGDASFVDHPKYQELVEGLENDEGETPMPSGSASWGVYPVVDYETTEVGIGMLFIVELAGTHYADAIAGIVSDSAEEFEEVDLVGRNVTRIKTTITDDFEQITGLPTQSSLYFVSSDGYFIVGTEPDGVATALLTLDGEVNKDSLGASDDFVALMDRCGTDGDVYAAVMLTNLADTVIQMDQSGMSMMFLPMLKSFFGDVDAMAETVSFMDNDDLTIEGTYAVYMGGGRDGILGLISEESPESAIPGFVGDNTLSYVQATIDFEKIVPLIKEIIASEPMLAMQLGPQQIEQVETGVALALAPLGSTVHVVTTGHLPIDESSLGYMAAIECRDEEGFMEYLSVMMPSMGATPSDFLGSQIYTLDMGGSIMLPVDLSVSVATGGGFAFVGTTKVVEDALRIIANPKDATGDHGGTIAGSFLDHEIVSAWGYGDPKRTLEIQNSMTSQTTDDLFADIEEFDPEMAEEMRIEFAESVEFQTAMVDLLSAFLGPMAWTINADETGFTSNVVMLRNED